MLSGEVAEATYEHTRCLKIYNELRPDNQRTTETPTERDILGLVPYDYV